MRVEEFSSQLALTQCRAPKGDFWGAPPSANRKARAALDAHAAIKQTTKPNKQSSLRLCVDPTATM
jgi:hypothetical protein